MKILSKKYVGILAFAFCLSCIKTSLADVNVIYNNSYITRALGSKIGEMKETLSIDNSQPKKVYKTTRNYEFKINRVNEINEIKQDITFYESENGEPLSFEVQNNDNGSKLILKGKFLSDGKLKIVKQLDGRVIEEIITLKSNLFFPNAIRNLYLEDKDKLEYCTIDVSSGFKIIKVLAEKEKEEFLSDEKAVKYKIKNDLMPDVVSYEWHDKSGKLIKSSTSALNIEIISESLLKDTVLEDGISFDLIKSTLIPVNQKFEPGNMPELVNYKIEFDDEYLQKNFPNNLVQTVFQNIGNASFVRIKSDKFNENIFLPLDKFGMDEYIQSGEIVSYDEEMKNKAHEIILGENNAYKASKKLEKWVSDAINNKNYSNTFLSSKEVFKKREGDCTEHAVLLAGMLRSVGIPSKIAVGLYYVNLNENENAFAYHMWTKAYIGNRWISLDAVENLKEFSPLHVELAESPLNSIEDINSIVYPIVIGMNKIKISILNYQMNSYGINVNIPESSNADSQVMNLNLASSSNNTAVKKIDISNSTEKCQLKQINLQKNNTDNVAEKAFSEASKGNYENALSLFEKAARLIEFNDDFSNLNLAKKMAISGFFSLSEKQLKNINEHEIWKNQIFNLKSLYFPVSINDENKYKPYVLATVKYNTLTDNADDLIQYINTQKNVESDDYFNYLLGKAYSLKKDYKTANNYFNKAVKLNPINMRYRFDLAKSYLNIKNCTKAKEELLYLSNAILDKDFKNLIMLELFLCKSKLAKINSIENKYYESKYYALKGDYSKALSIVNQILSKHHKHSKTYSLSGDLNYKIDNINVAESNYNNALKYDHKNDRALIGLGNISVYKNDLIEAEKFYLKALKLNDNNNEVVEKLADFYNKANQLDKAKQYYEMLLTESPLNCYANYQMGLILTSQGKNELSVPYFRKALLINPYNEQCWIELAKGEIKKGNSFIARNYLRNAGSLNSKNPEYYYYMGVIDKINKDYNSARLNFEQATMLKSDYIDAIIELKSLDAL